MKHTDARRCLKLHFWYRQNFTFKLFFKIRLSRFSWFYRTLLEHILSIVVVVCVCELNSHGYFKFEPHSIGLQDINLKFRKSIEIQKKKRISFWLLFTDDAKKRCIRQYHEQLDNSIRTWIPWTATIRQIPLTSIENALIVDNHKMNLIDQMFDEIVHTDERYQIF